MIAASIRGVNGRVGWEGAAAAERSGGRLAWMANASGRERRAERLSARPTRLQRRPIVGAGGRPVLREGALGLEEPEPDLIGF